MSADLFDPGVRQDPAHARKERPLETRLAAKTAVS